jgi:NAD(P)-dependent dehydrogenase (short-subunit alcohol dehydrogenase family)
MAARPPAKKLRPAQHQKRKPGLESPMKPLPEYIDENYQGSKKLEGKVALITGGDSGIGRAVALAFAKEGADIAIIYYNEDRDAKDTQDMINIIGQACIIIAGDLGDPTFCKKAIHKTIKTFNKLDILVNNAAEQHPEKKFEDITRKHLERTFSTNVFAYFYMIKYALAHLKKGASIINTTSVTAYRGSAHLIDYSASKGAIVSLTRSLSSHLISRGIRVNAVAPGPIWTPLIPSTFNAKKVSEFGSTSPMKRAGQPKEVAPAYVFLASSDSSYISGQVIHPNGGEIING